MRPLDVEILMHAYCIAAPHPRYGNDVVRDAFGGWEVQGVIEWNEEKTFYKTTELGKAFVHLILSTPIPKINYVDSRTGKPVQWFPA